MAGGVYDNQIGEKAVRKFQALKLYKGEFAGKPLKLLPWQADFVRKVLGTIDPATGLRQYTKAALWLPEKNGKTTLAAAFCMYFLLDPTEKGGGVVSAATTRDQAALVYETMRHMREQDPYLSSILEVNKTRRLILNKKTQSVYQAIASDAGYAEGQDISAAVVDEIHAARDRELFDVITGKIKARRQPFLLSISTAGSTPDPENFGYQEYQYAKNVASGLFQDDAFLPVIYEAPESDDPFSMETVAKANPSLGITINPKAIEQEIAKARNSPQTLRRHRRKTLNQWVACDDAWLDLDIWKSNAGSVDLAALAGKEAYLGVDFGARLDLTAAVLLFPQGTKDSRSYLCHPFFFIPEKLMAQKEEKDHVPYRVWKEQGLVIPTPGETTDYPTLRRKIEELAKTYRLRIIAIDRWNLGQMADELMGEGHKVAEVRQDSYSMSPALKETERLLIAKKLTHPDHPVLNWCAANARVVEGNREDIRIEKDKSSRRIDGIVALANAMFAALSESIPDESDEPQDMSIVWI